MKTGYSVAVEVTTKRRTRVLLTREDILQAVANKIDRSVDMEAEVFMQTCSRCKTAQLDVSEMNPLIIEWETVETTRDEETDDADTE